MIWRGLAVGVLISAPMGPVGILCIQRTLDKGRKAGFYTGIGAAISDLFYCLLTGFGLSFIEDFLNDNQDIIQLIGSLVLIAFSIYLFRKNPSSSLRRPLPQDVSAKKNILGGFLFTFSNPLIIFLIIGLFARFNFTAPEIKGGFYAIGYVFIILGALTWWYAVTYLIDKVRARFNMRSMKVMNIIIGIVILAFACVGIVTSIIGLTSTDAKARSYAPALRIGSRQSDSIWSEYSNPSCAPLTVTLYSADPAQASAADFILDFKLANLASHPSKKYYYTDSIGQRISVASPPWGLLLRDADGREIALQFHNDEYSATPLSSQRAVFIEASLPGGFSCSRAVEKGVATSDLLNHYRLSYNPADGLSLRMGRNSLSTPIVLNDPERIPLAEDSSAVFGNLKEIALILTPAANIRIGRERLRLASAPDKNLTSFDAEEISYRMVRSADPLEGRWRLFDYTLEDNYLKLGGDYEIIIMRRPEGDYEMIYQSGATICRNSWQPGMLKGLLTPTGLDAIYDVRWRDVNGLSLTTTIKAQLESPDILTLRFPVQSSSLRFARLP